MKPFEHEAKWCQYILQNYVEQVFQDYQLLNQKLQVGFKGFSLFCFFINFKHSKILSRYFVESGLQKFATVRLNVFLCCLDIMVVQKCHRWSNCVACVV